ncbi:Rossmann-like and DUF2520 domain-containing protein [Nocardioides sp. CFH 31398]|uniref:Rossmann-like and DUF2520 domain-containing protein n=1 Tax=Nocardioides sp. CFH 31398 TaxID=2919579 RepID=UPI001F0645D2|nr:Rossmann-like and DUF2520 domain-containing protein [Nocardioides sp. CFH 31398]MCH1866135.1 DUF2520 domain-containing protein [Nocardioides sp. CFH 31398]
MTHHRSTLPTAAPTDRPARRVGLVGAGRVGAVLGAALRDAGHEIVGVSGDSEASKARAAALLDGVPLLAPAAVAEAAEVLVLAVPDDALLGLVEVLVAGGSLREGQYVVHTSGRHGLAVLAAAADVGARPVALHPAMTFTGTRVDLDRLRGAVVGVTAGPGERRLAEELVAALGATATHVDEGSRTLYHAGLAHGANHLVTLVAEARETLAAAGVADPSALLGPLLRAALDGALAHGDGALTGPVVRGDAGTVAGHLAELADAAPQALTSYAALARATLARAEADGRVAGPRADALRRLLDRAPVAATR